MNKTYKLKVWWLSLIWSLFIVGFVAYMIFLYGFPEIKLNDIRSWLEIGLLLYGLWWFSYAFTYKFVLDREKGELIIFALGFKVKTYKINEIKKYFFEGTIKEFNPGEVSQRYVMQKSFYPSGRYITHVNLLLTNGQNLRMFWNMDPIDVKEIFEEMKKINSAIEEADDYFYPEDIFHKSLDWKYLLLILISLLFLFFYYFSMIFLKK